MDVPDLSGDRWFTVTEDDRRGKILVVAIICCAYCPLILALRAIGSLKNYGLNDFLIIAAIVTGIAEYVLTFVAVSYGLGLSFEEIRSDDAGILGRLVVASQVFFLLTLTITKCSVVILCRRLFSIDMKRNLMVCDTVAILCVLWGIASIFAVTISCSPAQQIGFEQPFCSGLSDRWAGVASTDGLLELLIFMLAAFVVFPLQMRVRRKIEVLVSFLPRLATIIVIGLHARSIRIQTRSQASGTNLADPSVYRQVLLICSISTAAVPALNRSLRMFHSSMGGAWMATTKSYSGDKTASKNSRGVVNSKPSIALQSIENMDKQLRLRPDPVDYSVTTYGRASREADAQSGRSHDSSDSKIGIIHKQQQWVVRHEMRK